jgi:UDP-N-acetyl-D-glucosamine dehydrogenase
MLRAADWPGGVEMKGVELTPAALAAADCVVIVTDHKAFDYAQIVASARLVVDTRNATKGGHPNVFRLGAPNTAQQELPA